MKPFLSMRVPTPKGFLVCVSRHVGAKYLASTFTQRTSFPRPTDRPATLRTLVFRLPKTPDPLFSRSTRPLSLIQALNALKVIDQTNWPGPSRKLLRRLFETSNAFHALKLPLLDALDAPEAPNRPNSSIPSVKLPEIFS
ncbi:hypothetical protein FALBO_9045 [Fusarium albosuccineum]|uniref:Uncharacterized protein n=1 Tax=Fusarium albosuccineum TaxID=1237068 RepID=A0A8H4L9L3_9HYPO|nr:hypothetical protein FALBO_9045 [Fusarium albosuccineum]